MKTYSAKAHEIKRTWYLVDANDKPLGRLASEIAKRLRGKHKPEYTPHMDTGDYIVVINAEKVKLTGNKEQDKFYYRHSGYPGGLTATRAKDMRATHPERMIKIAVKGMLPKGPLGRQMFRKLKVYTGIEHEHHAQQPVALELLNKA